MPQAPKAVEERALSEFNNDVQRAAKQIANDLGPAPGTQKASDSKLRAAWWTRDPNVDRQVVLAQMMTRGLPPQVAGKLVLVQPGNRPDWLQLYLHQADPNTAQVLAAFAEYPFRAGILATEADPEDRAKLAERLTGQGPPQARQAPPVPSGNKTAPASDGGAAQPAQQPQPQQPPAPAPPMAPGQVMGG